MVKLYSCKTYAEAITLAGERAAAFGKDPTEKMFAFCEDKLTMSLEKEVARACGGGTFNVQVTSFSRFIHRFSREKGAVLDKESSAMAVKNILLSSAEDLTCFKRSAYNPGTAVTVYELIAQLKSANVTPEDLNGGLGNLSGALKGKIKDIIKIYEDYENYIKTEGYFDSNSYLSLMPELLKNGSFKGASAMLVGFGSFTRQGLQIVKALCENLKDVFIFALAGENAELYTNEVKTLLMREIGGITVSESGFNYSVERAVMMKYLFEPSCFSAAKTVTDKISIYEAADPDDEIKYIAKEIRNKILSGLRYKDIAVAVGNPQSYSLSFDRIFGDYGIPYFLDNPLVLAAHPIAEMAVKYLDMCRRNFRPQDVIAFEKNPFVTKDKSVSDAFENFCLKNALTQKNMISGLNRALSAENCYGTQEETALFETERQKIVCLSTKCETVADFVKSVINMYSAFGVQELAEHNAAVLREYGNLSAAAFTEQAYQKIISVLDSVERILGNAVISISDFRNILVSGLSACKISVLPQLSDAVYIGDYKECKYLEHKILFAAGLNGEVPFAKSDTAILTDRDLSRLEKFNCKVDPKIRIVNRRERENVGVALLSFTDRLYLSRSATGADGKPAPKGRVTDYFSEVFRKPGGGKIILAETDKNNLKNLIDRYNSPRPAMEEFLIGSELFREGLNDALSAETAYINAVSECLPGDADKARKYLEDSGAAIAKPLEINGELVLKGDTVTASILETYFSCPYACFLKYGLKLTEREEGEVQSNEFGNFLHSVLEDYVSALAAGFKSGEDIVNTREESDALINAILQKHIKEYVYARYLETEKYSELFKFVGREARRVAYGLLLQIKSSAFRPVGTEVEFKDGGEYKPIAINTAFGKKKIIGKIDRIDKYGDYVRIIDYKTGKVHDRDEEFYTGNNVQLYLYMNAFLQGGGKAAGAYYLPVSDKFADGETSVYALHGKTLLKDDVLIATDGALTESGGYSDVLDISFVKKGDGLSSPRSRGVLSEEALNAYMKYAVKIAERGVNEISEGIITPSPYDGECTFCKYSGICGFDCVTESVRKETGVTDKTITDAAED